MTNQDRNFDDISHKFRHHIYGTSKGKIREILVWQQLEELLSHYPKEKKLHILDAGGGQGQLAIKLAKLGHHVTLCDISTQMLALAQLQAQMSDVTLNLIHCAIQELTHACDHPQYDIVICHAVLEWVNNPTDVLVALKRQLKPNGQLSLMFYNLHGLLFKTVTLGNFGYTRSGLAKRKKKTLSPDYPRLPCDVYHWLSQLDFTITDKIGIRVFHDYLIDKNKQQSRFDELLEIELQYCREDPYIHLARYILVSATNGAVYAAGSKA